MKVPTPVRITLVTTAALIGLVVVGGCTAELLQNLTKERGGEIQIAFVNDTEYRALFTYGAYDAWDRTPGPVEVDQLTLEAKTSSSIQTMSCARNFAVGTQGLLTRILDRDADESEALDLDILDVVVRFSSAPAGSDGEKMPTAGTAAGVEKLLGVDFSCEDRLIFTFVEDPDAEGGFRIDYEVILDDDGED